MSGRRALALTVAAVIAAGGLVACGSDKTKTGDAKAELQIWVRKPPGSDTEKTDDALAATFTQQTGIPTEVTALFDDFDTKLQQAATQ